jgi:AAHS family 4-hydroxybenzoate transporter-like MFS transporter
VALIGFVGTISEALLMAVEFAAGFCVLGLQFALNALAGIMYATSFRSKGSGWALGIGRVGSIVGPILGGVLIAQHMPVQRLYLIGALPFVLGTIICIILARLYSRRFGGMALNQRS